MRFHFHTYGCQMNVRDSESAAALLAARGHVPADGEAAADVVIVNTCSVRGKAEDKALGKLGLLVAGKRDTPGRRVGVIGCLAQRLRGEIFLRVPGLDFALGTRSLGRLPAVLEAVAAGRGPVLDTGEDDEGAAASLAGHLPGGVTAFVNILLGCERRCTYCIVPEVRGREWSRPAAAVLDEVRHLASQGVREVTLLGQSVMSYGRLNAAWPDGHRSPLGFREPLPRLLEAVAAIDGIARIRFTSGHPSGCTPELAAAMRAVPAVCEHLHLPLQSGSDDILRRMARGYTADEYRAAVARLRGQVPDLTLTTDLIVGFPGERIEDVERTRAFCDEIGFDGAFIFKYSPRPGTPAAAWPDDIAPAEKLRRNKLLLADADTRGLKLYARQIGAVAEVLAEGPSKRNPARWTGRTRGNRIVLFDPPPGARPGQLLNIRIDRARPQTLYGEVTGAESAGRAGASGATGNRAEP